MRFDTLALDAALGAILAHSLATPEGTIKKGRPLTARDLELLRAAGIVNVLAGRLDADEVGEDCAAAAVALQISGSHTTVAAPFTGRANIYSAAAGLAQIDAAAVARLNGIDEAVTIATVTPFERVQKGQMLATVKIIPFAVPGAAMAALVAAGGAKAVATTPFVAKRAALILTRLPTTKASVLKKRATVIGDRLTALGASLAQCETVAHTVEDVARAIAVASAAQHSPILVFAASAIVDRADIVPQALVAAGGEIVRFGMPVDPGNLLLLGRLGAQTVIGIPSCAGSPKLNGFDYVLERVMVELPITAGDIGAMGVGGLLKEISSRPQPRDGSMASAPDDVVRSAPRIGAVLLAGGRSSRMGAVNKLLQMIGGRPIVRHTTEALLASSALPVIVVLGHTGEAVRTALAGLDVRFVENPRFADGISTSLKVGLEALPPDVDGALVTLGDMPEVPTTLYNRMIAAFAPKDGRSIVMPIFDGKRGNPVLWDRRYFAEMMTVVGDFGAKHLLGLYGTEVAEIDADAAHVLTDIDTPEALAALKARIEI
ncbi:MAG: NTP transferase domain-containing protein [Hyphomicrobiaceae bacterium]|nr:NTP transferase domain-containing protein [Hyphomicrobiaceae bacterium]